MSKKNIECKIMSIEEFLSNNNFKLLKSQREYKWQKEQIEEFINDFKRSYDEYKKLKDEEKINFNSLIGTIYTINDNGYSSIIDGQQRTVSTLITIKVLTEVFLPSNKKDNYYKYYYKKFLSDDKERRKDEIKYYDVVFNSKDNISFLNSERTMSNIVNNVFNTKSLLSKLIYDEDEYLNFLEFIINKVNVIKIEFNDYKLAFDTFIKVNARGIELTNVELIYSYIWTLSKNEVRESIVERFSKKFNITKAKFFENENKKMETKDKEFDEAFLAAYKCFHNDEQFKIEYNPKNMFKEIVKGMENCAEDFLNDFLLNKWMFYIDSYFEIVNKTNNPYYKARNFLIKSKRKEYIPLLGYMNYMDDEFSDYNQKKLLIDMIKLISVWTSIKDIYIKDELKGTVGKFDSESLKFYNIFDLIRSVFSNNRKISKDNFKEIILENFGDNFFQYLDECIDYDFKEKKWVIKIWNEFVDLYQEYIND